jgi:IPT/TIG domain-containing protein
MNSRRVVSCLGALASALLATTASASAATPAPVVKSISPMAVKVGQKLTVKGKNFVPGKGKTRVFFIRRGGGTAFARVNSATKTSFVVTVPAQLDKVLKGKAARVQLRVLAKKFGSLSAVGKSPVVSPSGGNPGGPPVDNGPAGPNGDCDKDGTKNSAETDMDNDLLTNDQEKTLALDPCSADTDLDTVGDGFEYQSALDLNRTVLFGATPPTPYPGKRPYPNPLFADGEVDYDGDGLTLGQENVLWKTFGDHTLALNYSDGLQTTVPTALPADPLSQQLDTASWGTHYNDGQLDDGERDADGDKLSNWDEANGRMNQDWWTAAYKDLPEKVYPLAYSSTSMIDPDTDGDGVNDGADDQDHDGLSNAFEVARPWNWMATYVSTSYDGTNDGTYPPNPYARVQPFNPCKPVFSNTCHRHPQFNYYGEDEDWEGISPAAAGAPGVIPGPLFAP